MNTNERCTAPVSREKGQIRQIRSASYMVPIYWQCPDHAVLALIRPDNVRMRGGSVCVVMTTLLRSHSRDLLLIAAHLAGNIPWTLSKNSSLRIH